MQTKNKNIYARVQHLELKISGSTPGTEKIQRLELLGLTRAVFTHEFWATWRESAGTLCEKGQLWTKCTTGNSRL